MSNRMRSFLLFAGLLAALYLLSGCSASWHYQKALRKDPAMFVKDTVTVIDTVWIEVAEIDTLFRYQFDTVEFWKDSVYVKYFYRTIDSLVYIQVDCPDCPQVTKTNTITETVTVKPTLKDYFKIFIISIFALIGVFLIAKLFT